MTDATKSTKKHVVELDERGLRIDGVFRPLIAGSFEYWRHNNLYWRKIIRLMRECGLEFISTFICWDYHELKPGDFDFTGITHPTRDLAGFIDMCGEENLLVLIRFGPNIDAEWPTRGPAPDVTPLERLQPKYFERTREYFKALEPIIVPRLATNGGPIVLVSLENEIFFPYSTDVETDPSIGSIIVPYNEEFVMKLYREWLERKYNSSEELASAWGQPDLTFAKLAEPDYREAGLIESLDSFEFVSDSVQQVFVRLKEISQEIGIDVPIYSNMKQFTYYIDWRDVEKVVESHGINLHFPNAWPGDQKLVASWYIRLLRALNRFPWAPEFGSTVSQGDMGDLFGVLDADYGRFSTMFSMALGLRGLCYYMFVERDDDMYAPINPIGKVRVEKYEGYHEAVNVLKQLRPDRHIADIGLLWSIDHHRCQVASGFSNWRNLYDMWIDMDVPKELEPWWKSFRALHKMDADFDIVPMDQSLDNYKVLIYAGPDFARRADLESLKKWVDEGGKLIVTTAIPIRSVNPKEGDLTDIGKAINQSPNLILRPWGSLGDVLGQIEVQSAIHTEVPNMWTFAYQEDNALTLFVAHAGAKPEPVPVRLGTAIIDQIRNKTATDLLSGHSWKVTNEELWDEIPILKPNEVRCIRIRKEKV